MHCAVAITCCSNHGKGANLKYPRSRFLIAVCNRPYQVPVDSSRFLSTHGTSHCRAVRGQGEPIIELREKKSPGDVALHKSSPKSVRSKAPYIPSPGLSIITEESSLVDLSALTTPSSCEKDYRIIRYLLTSTAMYAAIDVSSQEKIKSCRQSLSARSP